jgi:plastocyanin
VRRPGTFVAAAAAVLAFVPAAHARLAVDDGALARVPRVSVRAVDFGYDLSRVRVPVGRVEFRVANRGDQQHDFAIAGRRMRVLEPGERGVVEVRFRKPGRYSFLCTVPGHARLGMKGTLVVGKPPEAAPSEPDEEPVTRGAGFDSSR